jgi:hypothetical protein
MLTSVRPSHLNSFRFRLVGVADCRKCEVLCRGVGQLHKFLTKISENLLVFPKLNFGGTKNAHKENRDLENIVFFKE